MAKKHESVMRVPVSFAGVNVGDKTAKIGLSIHRGNLTINKADTAFTDKRLSCEILARPNGDAEGQTTLPGMDGIIRLTGVADVKGLRATGKAFAIGLTFNLKMIDVKELAAFAKREGELVVNGVEEIPEEARGEEEDE